MDGVAQRPSGGVGGSDGSLGRLALPNRRPVATTVIVGPIDRTQRRLQSSLAGEPAMKTVRLVSLVTGAFSHVRNGQRGDDDEDFPQTSPSGSLQDHASHTRVDGDLGELMTDPGESWGVVVARTQRSELVEKSQTIIDLGTIRGLHEGKVVDRPQTRLGHLQDDRSKVGAQDLRLGELGTGLEVLLGVQPDADSRSDTATPSGALVGTGLADGLDGQTLHLGP